MPYAESASSVAVTARIAPGEALWPAVSSSVAASRESSDNVSRTASSAPRTSPDLPASVDDCALRSQSPAVSRRSKTDRCFQLIWFTAHAGIEGLTSDRASVASPALPDLRSRVASVLRPAVNSERQLIELVDRTYSDTCTFTPWLLPSPLSWPLPFAFCPFPFATVT